MMAPRETAASSNAIRPPPAAFGTPLCNDTRAISPGNYKNPINGNSNLDVIRRRKPRQSLR